MAVHLDKGYLAVLFVRDLAVSRRLYVDLLGMVVVNEDGTSVCVRSGDQILLLICPDSADELLGSSHVDHEGGGGARIVLVHQVDDVDAAFHELRDAGVTFLREPEDRRWGLRTAHFADPDGHVWEINAPVGAADPA
jgi:catechol 2,3-dioxygenase-like lactoylglutathione lyase family enzyme